MSLNKYDTLDRAKELLKNGSPENLRYACLEFRLCIESICYEKLKIYEKHVPEEIFSTWQPRKVIETLLEYDPDVMENYEIGIWCEKADGSRDKLIFCGAHINLRFDILKKHYNKLGYFLHVPTLAQQSKSYHHTDIKSYLESILPDIEAAASNTFDGNIAPTATYICKECDHHIVRNVESLRRNPIAICRNEKCKAEHHVTIIGNSSSWKLAELDFECPECKKKNHFGKHRLLEGQVIRCFACSSKYVLSRRWYLNAMTEDKT